jgi:hypothetical protein
MKPLHRVLLLFLVIRIFSVSAWSQVGSAPLCGTATVNDPTVVARAWNNTLAKYPELRRIGKRAEGQKEFALGTIDTLWVFNFTSTTFDRVPAELMAVGLVTYVWVAVEEMQNGHIDTLTVNELLQALEVKTPQRSRDSTKGIVVLDRQFFGDPPNINSSFVKGAGDGKTHFLVCDIKDGWTQGSSGGYIAGFFFNVDVDGSFSTSNRRDMLYIDSYPGIYFNGTRDFEQSLNTLAHEFQHLIHWNYDPGEISFFNEGLSEYASYVCGYGLRSPGGYFDNTNVSLLGWSSVLDDYSRAALWTLYVSDQHGDAFIRNLVQNSLSGPDGFDNALVQSGAGSSFASTVRNFHIANIFGNRQANPAYGYRDTLAFLGKPAALKSVLGSSLSGTRTGLMPLAADYLRFLAAETLQTTVTGILGTLSIKGLQIDDAGLTATDLTAGVPFQATYAGSQRSEFLLVVHNDSIGGAATYGYSSSGVSRTSAAFELAHDDGSTHSSPNMLLQGNDTVFVRFEGIEGGIIDSVALWFASQGTARLLLRDYNLQYSFVNQPLSGFGGRAKMFSPVSFSVNDTGFMKTVIPLRQFAMSSSPDFVVEIIYDAPVNPMLRRDTSQTVLHSFLSLSARSPQNPERVIYQSFGDFYVRVYLSPGGENPPVPIPLGFAMLQNYPNPFNSTTLITYDLPVRSQVRLAVYDLLGREVVVLKDGVEDAQRYVVPLNAGRMSSGVYFYKLTTPTFNETKKMVLVR